MKIATAIEENSIVLIDEPENSLHPSWQIRYIKDIEEIFCNLNLKIHFIISSHSAYMLSSLEEKTSSLVTVKSFINNNRLYRDFELVPYSTFAWSMENIIYNVFNVKTTRNPYIEEDLINLLHFLSNGKDKISLERANEIYLKLNKLSLSTEDPLHELLIKYKNQVVR